MRSFLFFLALALLVGCNFADSSSGESPANRPDSVVMQVDTLALDYPPQATLTQIHLRLLKVQLQPADSILDSIAAHFNEEALNLSGGSDFAYQSFQQRADSLVAERQRYNQDFEGFKPTWELVQNVKVVLNEKGSLGLNLQQQSYTGGAHPNLYSLYRYYRLRDGAVLDLNHFFPKESHRQLRALAEAKLREEFEIAPQTPLNDAGFWFEDNTFTLAENFAYNGQTLSFIYNPYEVGPYSMGSIVISLTAEELKNLPSGETLNL